MNIKKYIKNIIFKLIKYIYKLTYKFIPIDSNMILFVSYHGRGYLCNPKYLHIYLVDNDKFKNYKFIWAVKNSKSVKINNAKVVRYNGILYFYYLARSKYWIINCKMPNYILKKESQIYVQTWHGTPLKRLAHDIEIGENATFYRTKVSKEQMTKSYDNDVKKYSYFISPNKFSTEKFKTSFRVSEERIIETGYPRNDFLTKITSEKIKELKKKYNIPINKKVILYAPTWRDNSFDHRGYIFELKVNFELWKEYLGNEYIVIFKPHYLIKNIYNNVDNDFVYTISENEDINELYVISDILITDYSSVFFDYAILKRPIYFYMYDLEQYRDKLRGFYLDINKDLPGEIITDELELLKKIAKNEEYFHNNLNKIQEFNKIYNNLQDGESSKRVIEKIFKQSK